MYIINKIWARQVLLLQDWLSFQRSNEMKKKSVPTNERKPLRTFRIYVCVLTAGNRQRTRNPISRTLAASVTPPRTCQREKAINHHVNIRTLTFSSKSQPTFEGSTIYRSSAVHFFLYFERKKNNARPAYEVISLFRKTRKKAQQQHRVHTNERKKSMNCVRSGRKKKTSNAFT